MSDLSVLFLDLHDGSGIWNIMEHYLFFQPSMLGHHLHTLLVVCVFRSHQKSACGCGLTFEFNTIFIFFIFYYSNCNISRKAA